MWSTYDDQMSDEAMREVEREWYGDDEPWADPREWYLDQPTILLSAMRTNEFTFADCEGHHQLCEDCLSDPHCRVCADHSAHWYHVDATYGHEDTEAEEIQRTQAAMDEALDRGDTERFEDAFAQGMRVQRFCEECRQDGGKHLRGCPNQ